MVHVPCFNFLQYVSWLDYSINVKIYMYTCLKFFSVYGRIGQGLFTHCRKKLCFVVDERLIKRFATYFYLKGFQAKRWRGGLFFNSSTNTITFASDTTTHKIKFSFNTTTYTIKKTAIPKQEFMLVLCNEQANIKARICCQ